METKLGYRGLHNWVERKLGKPMVCWQCGDTTRRRYAWANKSGAYKQDLSDWERLCYTCHQRKDGFGFKGGHSIGGKDFCRRGHAMIGDNLYIKPSTKNRECRVCKKLYHSKEWAAEKGTK